VVPPKVKDSVPNIIGAKKTETPAKKQEAAAAPVADYDEAELEAEISDIPAAATENRPVIGSYRVTSKANFYNQPDENTLRSTFISPSYDKVVDAYEDKNGFIFVVYTNDLGYTSRGWLSKQDLTIVE
jgi:hypothetical protein